MREAVLAYRFSPFLSFFLSFSLMPSPGSYAREARDFPCLPCVFFSFFPFFSFFKAVSTSPAGVTACIFPCLLENKTNDLDKIKVR